MTSRKRPISTWMPDLSRVGRSKYRALADSLREAVSKRQFTDGERLPSQRELAERLGVNVATVTKAIAEASRLGLVVTRPGGGTYVVGGKPAAATAEANGGLLDLSLNIPPAGLVKPMLDDVIATLGRARRAEQLLGYAPLGGAPRDREAGSAWLRARGVEASPERVLVTQGAYEGLFAALKALTRPGDVVLTEALNYSGVRRLAELCRIKLVGIPVDADGLRPNALADACARHAAKVILTTPVTLNPTTATQDLRRRKALIAVAQRHLMTIIEDDIYGHLAGDPTPPLAALWPDGVVYVTSLSKCVAPGLRVGYLAAKERLISRLLDALLAVSWTAGSLQTAVANELIGSGLARACATAHHTEALNRLALARRILGQPVAGGPAATYHGWLRLPTAWSERDATAAFQRHGIIVSPAHHFVIGEQEAPAAVRLSLGAIADSASLELALGTIANVLDNGQVRVSGIV